MRETLDRRDHRPAPPRRAPSASAPGWLARIGGGGAGAFRLCLRRPGEVTGLLVGSAAIAAVCVNALGWQGGRHPAPLPLGAGAAPAIQAAKAAEKAADKAAPAKAQIETKAEQRPEPKAAARDPIGDAIRAGETTASVTPKAATTKVTAAKGEAPVLQAQLALAKLGYGPIKADGVMGAGTRAAIEKFERDRKLPVKGEAEGRTLRELAARAAAPKG